MPHLYFACNKITSRLKRLSYFFLSCFVSQISWSARTQTYNSSIHWINSTGVNQLKSLLLNSKFLVHASRNRGLKCTKFNTFIEVTESTDVVELVEAPNDIPTVSATIFWLPRGLSSRWHTCMPSWDMLSLLERLFDVYQAVVIGIFKYSTKEMVKPKFNFTLFLFVVVCMCFWTHKQLFLFCFLWHTCSSQTPTTNIWFIE